ncbi:MAG: TolC family protein [Bacteroidetes bacterium]|nr:TolC family protein [Bacteroidota bacterium]
MIRFSLIVISIILLAGSAGAQEDLLTKWEAVEQALEFNYDIKVANNNVKIAQNNAKILNSGFLPIISTTGGINYSDRSIKQSNENGISFNPGGSTLTFNSSLGLNYTLFDGFGRQYSFKKAQQNAQLSDIQARQIVEGAILQLFVAYYAVARLSENIISQKRSLEISKERLLRANYSYEYGQNTQLDVLNAEVDVNTDSINYLTVAQGLENSKRDLNLLLGRDVNTPFTVDTTVIYIQNLNLEQVVKEAEERNTSILQSNNFIRSSEYDIRINNAGWMPVVGLTASYGWTKNDFDAASNFIDQRITGPNAGINLSWNLFDGGATRTRVQNARIALESDRISREKTLQQLYRDLNNAWTVYQTALFVRDAQKKNLETNRRNFERTLEQNKLGQVTSIEFRQAQVNLLNARLSYNQAKYAAKNAELVILQISGNLLDTEF